MLIIVFFTMEQSMAYAQVNLVPNPSFELHDSCPNTFAQINYLLNWKAINISPDYYHKCSTNSAVSIPYNCRGYQETTGIYDSAYIGLGLNPYNNFTREIIGTELIDPMQIGQLYYISFWVSPAFDLAQCGVRTSCFCDKLGIKFFTHPVNNQDSLIDNFAHLYSDTMFTDTTNWISFRGAFIADSAYTFLTIGNFFTSPELSYICYNSNRAAYYLIDNICVSTDSNVCYNTTSLLEIPTQKTTPQLFIDRLNKTLHINFEINYTEKNKLEIFDSTGRIIFSSQLSESHSDFPFNHAPGVYFVRIDDSTFKILNP